MKKMLSIFLLTILLLLAPIGVVTTPLTRGEGNQQFPLQPDDPVITNALSYLRNQQQESGAISGIAVSAWAAMALIAASEDPNQWSTLRNYLKNNVNKLDNEKATDWQRHTLALVALDENPRSCNGINYQTKILSFFDGAQMGNPTILYDDLFGLLALKACGIEHTDETIQTLKKYILENQRNDGSWGDVDATAIAIMALIAINEPNNSPAIQEALLFLKTKQTSQGGFHSWGSANAASTAWALGALVAANEDPTSNTWRINDLSPVDFLLSLQQPDGSFNWSHTSHLNPEWMTSYVIPSLLGQPYPVKCWDDGPGSEGNQDEDPDDNEPSEDPDDNNPNTSSEEQPEVEITLIHPKDHSLYVFNRQLPRNIQPLIIIGPINIQIHASPSIIKVDFLLNNYLYYSDHTPPYEWQLNQGVIRQKINLTIKAYADTNCYYQKKRQQCLENIVIVLTTMKNISELQNVIENLSRMNCINYPSNCAISQEFMYLNPFPVISLQLIERDRN